MRLISSILLLAMATSASAQTPYRNATQIGRVDSVTSAVLKETRRYLVYTPPSYDDSTFTPQRYPVLYLLDGDAHFHSVSGLLQILGTGVNGTYVVPEMIVVAIPNTDRTRDMTPTNVTIGFDGKPAPALKSSGGMANFFSFIKSELIPQIEARYRTTPYRIFVGHSLGGITTINALYTIPETFAAYVAIDPSLWWDNSILLHRAKDYFSTASLAGKALYVAQANTVNPDDTTRNTHFEGIVKFNAVMERNNASGLRYAYKYYGNDDHGSVPLIAEYDALRFIFDGYRVDLQRVLATPGALREHFRQVSAKLGAPFGPSERMVMMLGQFALSQDSTNGIEFYQMATDLFPTSARGFTRLGDLWNAKGDPKKARGFYQQALARDPNSQYAKNMLAKLNQ